MVIFYCNYGFISSIRTFSTKSNIKSEKTGYSKLIGVYEVKFLI